VSASLLWLIGLLSMSCVHLQCQQQLQDTLSMPSVHHQCQQQQKQGHPQLLTPLLLTSNVYGSVENLRVR
jgi:hypothetical protein